MVSSLPDSDLNISGRFLKTYYASFRNHYSSPAKKPQASGSAITLNIVLIINESPWGSTLSATAARLASGFADKGFTVQAVFFREDGVYNCVRGTSSDPGAGDLSAAWVALNEQQDTRLMVCQSSAVRRLSDSPEPPFREAGLVEVADLVADCDRVITF